MKRILISLLTIGVAGAAAFGASQAFFSDTETSQGNTFTAGDIDLQIDSTAHYNGMVCTGNLWVSDGTMSPLPEPGLEGKDCTGTWSLKDLVEEKFFNFADIKPGDQGENTISLLVINNDAWACVTIKNLVNAENIRNEAEIAAGDTTDVEGELAQNLYFTAWADDGDNVWETGEPLLFTNKFGPASDVLNGKTYTLADSTTGPSSFIPGGITKYIGIQWCAGTMTVNEGNHTIGCDGAGMDNKSQTDSVTADIEFYVEQARNNPNFVCSSITHGGQVLDYLNIGDDTSEAGHSLSGWSNNQSVLPYDGSNYGGGSSDNSFRLLMGPGDNPLVCASGAEPATFTMNAGIGTATKLTLEHLDGQVNDSFDVLINGNPIAGGHYTAGSLGTENWVVTPFTFPGVIGLVNVKLVTTNPVTAWCNTYGQVAFSNAKLE